MLLALALACAPKPAAPVESLLPPPSLPPASSPYGPARPELEPGWRYGNAPSVGVTDTDPAIGPADARFVVVSFADYFCPYCAAFWPKLQSAVARNPDVRLVLKNWPIDPACNPVVQGTGHRFACLAASAAECAGQQGRSSPMADLLYGHPEHVTPNEVPTFAGPAGLDAARFEACLADPRTAEAVSQDVRAGIDAGVSGTPAIYVWGLEPDTWVGIAPSTSILEAALAEARAGRPLPP
jgi:protein-disulfide isomerase